MKRSSILLIAISLAIFAGLLAFQAPAPEKGQDKKIIITDEPYTPAHPTPRNATIDADQFLVPELYEPSWSAPIETTPCKPYRAALVNHHALASDLIVRVMREIARCRPDVRTMIILSPDHYNTSPSSVLTQELAFATAGDIVTVDTSSTARLLDTIPSARDSSQPFFKEHGIGVLIPFLHRALPRTEVVPVMIKTSISASDRKRLSDWLKSEAKNGAFILVSSDMSHYLSESIAKNNDQVTLKALNENDASFFAGAKDGLTDNGPSIAATINALSPKFHLLGHSISSDYAGSPGFTTSYIVGCWE